MSEKINLTELRAELDEGSAHWERLMEKDTLLALVEAVEALRMVEAWMRRGEGSEADAAEAMDASLARFEFGQDR